MSRHTQDREDLLRDATALNPRLMLGITLAGQVVELFAGFRRGNALSLYFDSDPVYHFNSNGQLRRAFVAGRVIKADQGLLFTWIPDRTSGSVTMDSRALTSSEQAQLGENLRCLLDEVKNAMSARQFSLVGQFPAEGDGFQRLTDWLGSIPEFSVATSPNVG